MKDWLPSRAEKFLCEWQDIGCPGADSHYDDIAGNSLPVVEHNSFHAIVAFIQLGKPGAFAQFNAGGFRALNQCRNDATALHIACFQLKNAILIAFGIPSRKLLPQLR